MGAPRSSCPPPPPQKAAHHLKKLKATLLYRPRTFRTSYRTSLRPISRTRPLLRTRIHRANIHISNANGQLHATFCCVTVLWLEDSSWGRLVRYDWRIAWLDCPMARQASYMHRTIPTRGQVGLCTYILHVKMYQLHINLKHQAYALTSSHFPFRSKRFSTTFGARSSTVSP